MNAMLAGVTGFAFGFLFGFVITALFQSEDELKDDGENDEHFRG